MLGNREKKFGQISRMSLTLALKLNNLIFCNPFLGFFKKFIGLGQSRRARIWHGNSLRNPLLGEEDLPLNLTIQCERIVLNFRICIMDNKWTKMWYNSFAEFLCNFFEFLWYSVKPGKAIFAWPSLEIRKYSTISL